MDRIANHVLHLARFTLQARTALSIGTGGPDGVYDHPIVRDANGLPIIPGTSLAGVLRHLWIADHGGDPQSAAALFGFQARDQGEASRLEVAHCPLQDSRGRPAVGLLLGPAGTARLADPLFKAALATRDDPLFRDRVRLTHRGVASHQGKFDRGVLAAGHRFSGELRLWSTRRDDPDWQTLLGLLGDPRLRLGGATRAGLGAMDLIELHCITLDLKDPTDIARFSALGQGIGDHHGLTRQALADLPRTGAATTLRFHLAPRDFWRVGQGDRPILAHPKEPDLVPKLEPLVRWTDGRGRLDTRVALLPGSSVKGALAHRVAFHWLALAGRFVEDLAKDLGPAGLADWDKAEHCDGVRALFGYAKDRDTAAGRSKEQTGQAGLVIIDDVQLDLPAAALQQRLDTMIHNSLDRFTGGVRNRMLFTEELLYGLDFDLTITLLPGIAKADALARRALARALTDLCSGRLALGGGTTKGHGSFSGTPDPDARAWLAAQGEPWTAPAPLQEAA